MGGRTLGGAVTVGMADIQALVDQFERSSWRRLSLTADGIELSLSKDPVEIARKTAPPPIATPEPPPPAAAEPAGDGTVVTAPSLGTFFRSPKPGAPPFVAVGGRVMAGEEICLIEVMKLFTSVRTPHAGIVRAIHAEDGALVEFGQALMSIEADG